MSGVEFTPDADWLAPSDHPSKPTGVLPGGAVDAHCHVFGPGAKFPYSPHRKYTPTDATKEDLFKLRDFLGFERNVIVQASCHGTDNRALVDALLASDGMARGVAVVDQNTSDSELERLGAAGVKGIRFNFLGRLADPHPDDYYRMLARRAAGLGMHIVVYVDEASLNDRWNLLAELPTNVVIDHMGRPDVTAGLESEGFARIVGLVAGDPKFWIKVSGAERLTRTGPPYEDVLPFARTLVERFPDRVLWGTDWPHPNMRSHMPDDGQLVDLLRQIAPTPALRRALLVTNPMRLYWPESG